MITANQKKIVKSLAQKKFRSQYQCFVVEGVKLVEEALNSDFLVDDVFAVPRWIESNSNVGAIEVSEKELKSLSSLKTPNDVLAVVRIKQQNLPLDFSNLTLVLDNIQDPGNMGTIIRTADWFGIKNIVCSQNSVDIYNPKVVQATMGSLFRINILYKDLKEFFSSHENLTVYGASIEGESIYDTKMNQEDAVLLMGNESKGIAQELESFIDKKLTVPKFGEAESLNVATATAIICSEYKRG